MWNRQVAKGDLVYCLGDVSFGTLSQTRQFLAGLHGQIVVIKGNHDSSKDLDVLVDEHLIQYWKDYKEIKIVDAIGKKHTCCLFHFPIACWHKQGYGSIHLHGHSHSLYQGQGKCLDVGLDSAYNIYGEHRLFSSEDVLEYISNKEIVVLDGHKNRGEE